MQDVYSLTRKTMMTVTFVFFSFYNFSLRVVACLISNVVSEFKLLI